MDDFHSRFIAGVRHYLADKNCKSNKEEAALVAIPYQTYIKLMAGNQTPTMQHCIDLCEKCGYSANWLFLGIGEMELQHQALLNEILSSIKRLK